MGGVYFLGANLHPNDAISKMPSKILTTVPLFVHNKMVIGWIFGIVILPKNGVIWAKLALGTVRNPGKSSSAVLTLYVSAV